MTDTPTILKKILARKQQEIEAAREQISVKQLEERSDRFEAPRGFIQAIRKKMAAGNPAVIAEVKKASPSKGILREHFVPEEIAASYEQGGAACLSVLTDKDFFMGGNDYLIEARGAVSIPVLRKDFIIDPYQVYEARAIGADCILLIAAALNDTDMHSLSSLAHSLQLDVLVEVHNEQELDRALTLDNCLLGINNRNLHTFEVSLETTTRLLQKVPEDTTVVTESGILTPEDVSYMRSNGINSFLVGEAFMREPEPGEALRKLFY